MKVEHWPLDCLQPHPRQECFGDISDDALKALADSIEKDGLLDAILVTKDGTIVAGHQRYRAHQLLEKPTIRVRVIEGDGEREFYNSNLCRRDLSPIKRARAVAGLFNAEQQASPTRRNPVGELRKRIGEQLGISGRSVSRMLQLLRLPLPIQDAVDAGLSQSLALKVQSLPEDQQLSIAKKIADGEDPREIIEDALDLAQPESSEDDTDPDDLYRMLVEFLDENLSVLEASADSLTGGSDVTIRTARMLNRSADFFARMAEQVLSAAEKRQHRLEGLLEDVEQHRVERVRGKWDTVSQIGT